MARWVAASVAGVSVPPPPNSPLMPMAPARGGRHRGGRVAPVGGDEGVVHAQAGQQRQRLVHARRVHLFFDQRGGQVRHRRAAGVDVEDHVVARKQLMLQEMRQPLGGRAAGRAGKARFRLPLSSGERRRAAITAGTLAMGRIVISPHAGRVQAADQATQRDLAFVLVAVVAGHEQHARPLAIADAADRGLDLVIGERSTEYGVPRKLSVLPSASKSIS